MRKLIGEISHQNSSSKRHVQNEYTQTFSKKSVGEGQYSQNPLALKKNTKHGVLLVGNDPENSVVKFFTFPACRFLTVHLGGVSAFGIPSFLAPSRSTIIVPYSSVYRLLRIKESYVDVSQDTT